MIDGQRVLDEDCADGLHQPCLSPQCDCGCHELTVEELPRPVRWLSDYLGDI